MTLSHLQVIQQSVRQLLYMDDKFGELAIH